MKMIFFLSTLCCATTIENFNLDQLAREQLKFQPIYVQLPSGKTFLFWDLPFLRRLQNLQHWNHIEFRFNFTNNNQLIANHSVNSDQLHCPLETMLIGFCFDLENLSFDKVQYSIKLKNGTEIGQQSVVFKKAHHKGGHPANQTIEEMFHTLQSEVGQLRKHIEQLGDDERGEERFTRFVNGVLSAGEVILIWASPILAAIAAFAASKMGIRRANDGQNQLQVTGDINNGMQNGGEIVNIGGIDEESDRMNLI